MDHAPELPNLLSAVRGGDAAAREVLFDRFYPRVRRIVHGQLEHDFRRHHRWILPLFSTGDIVQEVFLGALDHQLDGFRGGDEDAFVQYMTVVVRNRLIDAMRYHEAGRRDARRQVEAPAADTTRAGFAIDDQTPSLAASLGEQVSVYHEVVAGMPPRQRQLVELRIEREESFAAIAERLGIASADAARQAFRAAKARLLVRLRARGLHAPVTSADDGEESS